MKRNETDGEKVIINKIVTNKDAEQKVDEFSFEENEVGGRHELRKNRFDFISQVYAVDIVMSSGEGKPREAHTLSEFTSQHNQL